MCFQTQVLVCVRCHKTRASAVRRACDCAGAYALQVAPAVFTGALRNLARLAANYGFARLGESVAWLLQEAK